VTALLEPRASVQSRLAVRGLRHRFGERSVLEGLSFEVQPGEIVGLLGPNGSGKSTTFRVLTGLLVPDAGTLCLDGAEVAPGSRALRQRMGVVFQAPSLDARLSVRENLLMSAALYGLRGADARARVDAALAQDELQERAGDRVLELSGGTKRRIELCRALLHSPSVLVMDEPTSGLDETAFRRAWARIEQLRATTGLTVLLSTHRPDEAARCDRVIVLDQGRAIAEGTPEALCTRVAGDVISLDAAEPEAVCAALQAKLGLAASVIGGRVVLERERGHELVPQLFEALAAGSIRALTMHRPTLADVFVKLTGRILGDTAASAAPAAGAKKH
jgi:ABC-2 type transport system ATP-binding protein